MTSNDHTVLVVEDDEDVREAMVGILESKGYTVCSARHGADALAQLRGGVTPCVILLDLMMPVMDGWAFHDETQKDPAFAGIPTVILSAVPPRDARNDSVRAVEHIPKPVDVARLIAAVERHC
jgi:CheY-like chemotaxis protein